MSIPWPSGPAAVVSPRAHSQRSMPDSSVQVGMATDVGPTRKRNEDAAVLPGVVLGAADRGRWQGELSPGPCAIVQVIDGMGGHGAGSVAATLCALSVNESAAQDPRPDPEDEPDPAWLTATLQRASDLVVDVGQLSPATQIMGAATAGIVVGHRTVLVFNVGDCRVYVLEDGYLSLLTSDHRARGSGGLTRSIGGTGRREQVVPDVIDMDRSVPRRYLLCSDGLTDTLDFEQILAGVATGNPMDAADALVAAAVAAGSRDNVTVITVDVPATSGSATGVRL